MLRTSAIVGTALSIVILTGIAQGLWSDRWGTATEPQVLAAKAARLPMTIGDWDGRPADVDFSIYPQEMTGICYQRTYVNRTNGAVISMYLTCGRPGPLSIHTPLICYPSGGYDMDGSPTKFATPIDNAPPAEFWQTKFVKSEAGVPSYLRILWSWSANGTWQAADSPRMTFARYPALFKMHVWRNLLKADEPIESDPIVSFIRVLVPELQKTAFANP